jgi:periplasmic copper chaperone A
MGIPRFFALMTVLLSCLVHADAPPAVRIENAWARATPPGVTLGAAFMDITATTADRLLNVSTPIADHVEIHAMTMDGGMMQMRQLTAVELPAGRRVSFEPTGMHLMLVGLKQPLAPNTAFELQLRFERSAEQTLTVRIRPAGQ